MSHVLAKDLRDAVLQAAMEGNLTERLPSDSSVLDLISAIAKEKESLIKQGKVEKAKKLPAILEDDIPFEIPETWTWERWGNLSNSIQYGANAGAQASGNAKLVRISDIQGNKVVWSTVPFCTVNDKEIEAYLLNENDILFARTGGTVGKSVIVHGIPNDGNKYIFAGYLIRSNYSSKINFRYLKYFMESQLYWNQLREGTIGSAQPNCNGKTLSKMMIPLPPVEEQARIVARLDELMAKIDGYEKIENELTVLHKKFPTDMKAAILQAAMQGKLTEQLANDENVNEYYSNIQAHRTQLIKEKVLKKENCLKEPIKDIPFDIPETWMWCHLGDCIQLISGADLTPDEYNDKQHGIVYLTGASNIENGRIIINRWTETPRNIAKKGDLLLTCKGTVGKTCFLKIDEVHIARQIMAIRAIDINPQYMAAFITYYVGKLQSMAKSMIPGIERANVLTAVFPLPPIEEQQRIVEKLDQLLPLCDQLEQMAA